VRLTQQLTGSFSFSVAYQRTSSNRRNYNGPRFEPRFASFNPFGEFEFVSISRGTIDTLDARLNARLGNSNLVTAGFELEHESAVQEFGVSFTPPPLDRQRTFAVFAQDQLSFLDDRLQLSFGVRGQFFRLNAADRPGSLAALNTKSAITGDGSVAYFFRSTNTKIRAHFGNGFRAPALYERFGFGTFPGGSITRFGDPTLKAEQSISVDAGLDQHLAGERVRLGGTYFYTKLKRAIVFTGLTPDPLGLHRPAGYANREGGIARGLETYLEASPKRGTDVRVAYTFTNSDRAGLFGGLLPEYVIPKHVFGFNLNQRYHSLAFNFDLNRTGAYIAPIFESDFPFRTAELIFSGYTKADLFGSYERRLSEGRTIVLFLGGDNIFNQRYYENGFLAPGVVGRGGVSFKF
jgi:iron complex outermembrane receptor protein